MCVVVTRVVIGEGEVERRRRTEREDGDRKGRARKDEA